MTASKEKRKKKQEVWSKLKGKSKALTPRGFAYSDEESKTQAVVVRTATRLVSSATRLVMACDAEVAWQKQDMQRTRTRGDLGTVTFTFPKERKQCS